MADWLTSHCLYMYLSTPPSVCTSFISNHSSKGSQREEQTAEWDQLAEAGAGSWWDPDVDMRDEGEAHRLRTFHYHGGRHESALRYIPGRFALLIIIWFF